MGNKKRTIVNEDNSLKLKMCEDNSFDSYNEDIEDIILEKDGYALTQQDWFNNNFIYGVYDQFNDLVVRVVRKYDLLDMTTSEIQGTDVYRLFLKCVQERKHGENNASDTSASTKSKNSFGDNWGGFSSYSGYEYKPKKLTDEEINKIVDEHCKSNTLVIHKDDPTTTMLKPIYEGKGWDELHNSYEFSSSIINKIIERHERCVLVGHGTPNGMFGFIDSEQAPLLADKKLFVIWCNADKYFDHYLPNKHGFFCTGNMPSDANEARWVGFKVSREYMDKNITDWCQYCADVVEQALEGDPEGAVAYIRNRYWDKYGQGYNVEDVSDEHHVKQDIPDEVRITKYNWIRTKVQ